MKVSADLHSKLGAQAPCEPNDWLASIKMTIARFARGSTAAQQASILLPSEQARQRQQAGKIAGRWETRFNKSKTR